MKIDLLHYSAPPIVGGVESVVAHHARLMAKAGHQVRILAGRGAQFEPSIPFLSIPLIDSRHPEILDVKQELDRGHVSPKFDLLTNAIIQLLEPILKETDLLIAHNVCSLHKNLPLTAALRLILDNPGTPRLILWHHDLSWMTPRYRSELYPGYPWNLLCTAWPGAKHVVVSELRQQELSGLIGISQERIALVPNGIDAVQFLGLQPQTRDLIDQLDLLTAEPLLLLPVRITPRKNIELALETLAAVSKDYPKGMLVITGPLGPHNPANVQYFERLKNLRSELKLVGRAHFLADLTSDYLPDVIIADFYRLADALLLPSHEEGFGIPILEAGLVGMPIFCTDIPPLRSLAGENAVYFSPTSKADLVARKIYVNLSRNRAHSMRIHVRKNFSWKQIYTQHIAHLLE